MITPPSRIGRFAVQRILGHGGMGVVYLAKDPQLGRDVAIKVLPPLADNDAADRLLNEARISGRFVHPNVIAIYEVGDEQGYPFFVMPYVEGRTLDAMIKAREPVPLSLALRWMVELCRGLSYTHGFHVVHRDIKPGNLIVDAEDVLRILDFGIAKVVATTQANFTAVGTPAYMAPEQYHGAPVDARTDVYAAGLVLFELLTGVRARIGDSPAQVYRQIASGSLPALRDLAPGLDPVLAEICSRATATDPGMRYQSARELGDALARMQTQAAYREQTETVPPDPDHAVTLAAKPIPAGPPAESPMPPPVPVEPEAPPAAAARPLPVTAEPEPVGWEPTSPGRPRRAGPIAAAVAAFLLGALLVAATFGVFSRTPDESGATEAPAAAGDTRSASPAIGSAQPAAAFPAATGQRDLEVPRAPALVDSRPPDSVSGAPPPPPLAAPVRVGGMIKAPTKLRNVQPTYPESARLARVQGTVTIEATIDPNGKVVEARVLRSVAPLDQAALDAVRQWEFSSTLLNGVPVPVIMTVTVNFTLESSDPATPTADPDSRAASAAAATGAVPRADERGTFSAAAGLLLLQVKPGREAAYERLLGRVRDALQRPSSGRRQMAEGWRIYRSREPMNGNALYVHVMRPAVRGLDYIQLYQLVHDVFPNDVGALHEPLKDAFPTGANRLNLERLDSFADSRAPSGDPPRASDRTATFEEKTGLLLVQIKAGETKTYESLVSKVAEVLRASGRSERTAMASGWKVYRSDQSSQGNAMYVSLFEPVVPGANYIELYTLLAERLPAAEAQAIYASTNQAFAAGGINKLDLVPVLDMSATR